MARMKKDMSNENNKSVFNDEIKTPVFNDEIKTKESAVSRIKPYSVEIIVTALNVRKKPDPNSDVLEIISNKETYIITDVKNGYGKLKGHKGWILLSYCKKI